MGPVSKTGPIQRRRKVNLTTYAIETSELTKRFPRTLGYLDLLPGRPSRPEFLALRNVDLQVNTGELFGLLGPNGAGKTTLMKILSTLILPTSGRARIHGYDVVKQDRQIRKIIGYVISEERSFYWRLTGRQNLLFFATMDNLSPREADRRLAELLELVGLADEADVPFRNYSKGMRSRLAIARALLSVPEVLFLDEPTRALDPPTAHAIRRFIRETLVGQQGKTVFLATHDLYEAWEMCDRIAIIDRGEIRTSGSPAEIAQAWNPESRYVLEVDSIREELLCEIQTWRGVISVVVSSSAPSSCTLQVTLARNNAEIADVVGCLVSRGVRVGACQPEHIPLYDAFTHFTGKGLRDGA